MSVCYELKPVESGEGASGSIIKLPSGKTIIGRGELLQVSDKRVSRNHAELSTSDDGKLVLKSTHNNPCFFRKGGNTEQVIINKDQSQELKTGDVFGLLPDSFFYEVTEGQKSEVKPENESNGATESKSCSDSKEEEENSGNTDDICAKGDEGAGDVQMNNDGKTATVGDKEMALPVAKSRKLPEWMMEDTGSSNESETDKKPTPSKGRGRPAGKTKKSPAAKARGRPPAGATKAGRGRPSKKRKTESDDEYSSDEEEVVKPKRKTRERKTRQEPEEVVTPSRPRRTASQNRPSYTDDLVLSDAEFSEESVEHSPPKRLKADEDSDFIAEEIDQESGSDWETGRKAKTTPKRSGRANPRRGKNSHRAKGHYVMRDDDEDEMSESEEEDSGSDWEKSRRKPKAATPAKAKPKQRKKKKIAESESEGDDGEDSDGNYIPAKQPVVTEVKKKTRPQCQYGDRCYRKKNAIHCKQLSHPGDDDWVDEEEMEEQEPEAPKTTDRERKKVKKTDEVASRRPKRQAAEKAAASLVDNEDEEEEEEDGGEIMKPESEKEEDDEGAKDEEEVDRQDEELSGDEGALKINMEGVTA